MLNPPDSTTQSHNRDGEGVEFHLPDEILVEILSRVPAVDVLRSRCVCKRWRDLTCTRNFTLIHMRRCLPILLFEEHITGGDMYLGSEQYLLDQFWGPLQTAPKRYKISNCPEFRIRLCFSMDGLVVMQDMWSHTFRIINPLFHEKVEIKISKTVQRADLCGAFLHPSLNEYCTLWRIAVSGESNAELVEYRILNLGSKPCWRVISNPWSHKARSIWIPPILIDEYLYWVVEHEPDSGGNIRFDIRNKDVTGIMEFDIRNEEFTLIPFPAPIACNCILYDNRNLLNIGGLISMVWTSPIEHSPNKEPFDVNILTLKDRARHLWTTSSFRINTYDCCWDSKPMALVNNVLVLHNNFDGFFSWNLKLCTLRKFEDDGDRRGQSPLTTHVTSLVSLRNCNSEIYVDERGEVEKNGKRRGQDYGFDF